MQETQPIEVKPKSVRRPGRPVASPEAPHGARDTILDVAEQMFAESGYASTSFRDIAARADVNPAMISYYFGSKQKLFETVFKRRGAQISERWHELLDALEARPGQPPTVEELMRSYLSVEFDMKKSGPAGIAFVKLQARIHNETDEFSFRLRREVYDVATKRYITALERALPDVDPADVNWRLMFVIGAFLYMLAGVDRLNDLSSGRFQSDDVDELTARAITFVVGGMMAPSTTYPPESGNKKAPRRRTSARR